MAASLDRIETRAGRLRQLAKTAKENSRIFRALEQRRLYRPQPGAQLMQAVSAGRLASLIFLLGMLVMPATPA